MALLLFILQLLCSQICSVPNALVVPDDYYGSPAVFSDDNYPDKNEFISMFTIPKQSLIISGSVEDIEFNLEHINTTGGGKGYDPEATSEDGGEDYSAFADWLQCYYNPRMRNMVDSNKRTIWFSGQAGPMAPKDGKSRTRKTKTHLDKQSVKQEETEEPVEKKTKLGKPTRAKVAEIAGKSDAKPTNRRARRKPNGVIKKEHTDEQTDKQTDEQTEEQTEERTEERTEEKDKPVKRKKLKQRKAGRASLKIKTEMDETVKGTSQGNIYKFD